MNGEFLHTAQTLALAVFAIAVACLTAVAFQTMIDELECGDLPRAVLWGLWSTLAASVTIFAAAGALTL